MLWNQLFRMFGMNNGIPLGVYLLGMINNYVNDISTHLNVMALSLLMDTSWHSIKQQP